MSGPFDLSGRVALVTGGNSGIGLGIAAGLAAAGARVVIAARNTARNDETVRQIGREATAQHLEVDDPASCQAAVAEVARQHGRLDILVNNAGINERLRPEAMNPDSWQRLFETNFFGALRLSLAALPVMRQVGGGKVINIGSIATRFGAPPISAYAASKAALTQLTRSLAVDWAADNIQVNCISPGWIDTDFTREARRVVPGLEEKATVRTPAGRWGRPEDVAGAAVFLASRAADFITGVDLTVDGGYTLNG